MADSSQTQDESPAKKVKETSELAKLLSNRNWSLGVSPSKPIDIPKVVKVEAFDPTQGMSNDAFFEHAMRNIWADTPTIIHSPIREVPVVNDPTIESVSNELSQRVCKFINKRKEEIPKINAPNFILRLTFVIGMISRPGVIMDSLVIPPTLANSLEAPLRKLHKRKTDGEELTSYERRLYELYKGFLFLKNITKVHKLLALQRYKQTFIDQELDEYQPWMESHTFFCPPCNIVHPYSKRGHPQDCIRLKSNGPRRIADLELENTWKLQAKAIVLGCNGLLYLPPLLRNWYINIGSKDYHEYSVPLTAEAIFDNCINHENSLIRRIEKVITLVGPESHLPILVEFFGSPNYSHIGMVYHLMGFAHAVRHCQYIYAGPIIIVIGPVMATVGDCITEYSLRKTYLSYTQKAGNFVGYALGVPITYIPMQTVEGLQNGDYLAYHFWTDEPLFSSSGSYTREFMFRIQNWLELFTKHVYDGITKPIGRVHEYRAISEAGYDAASLPHYAI